MTSLDIILRTCDATNVHTDWRVRYHGIEKAELIVGCLTSLINSINNANGIDINLTVLDDHSSASTVQKIEELLSKVKNSKFVRLEDCGYNNSAHQQWILCRDSSANLVYSVEDDYLHYPTAIQ